MRKIRTKYNLSDQTIALIILEILIVGSILGFHFYFIGSESSVEYDHPEWLPVVYVSSILSFFYLYFIFRKNKRLKKLAHENLLPTMTSEISSSRSFIKFLLYRLAILSVLIAIVNPKIGTKLQVVKTEGQDIIICLDVSSSMLSEDIKPNRLDRAKLALQQFYNKVVGDRVGLIVFAGEAYVQVPLTTDYEAAKLFLDGVDTEMISKQGTAIGAAIDLAVESFDWDNSGNKSIVVITDGENHEDNSVESARKAFEKGIVIHTIGMGTAQGGPIPELNSKGMKIGFKKDRDGNTVVSALDENMLKRLVNESNGLFIRASQGDVGIDKLLKEMNKVEKEELDTFKYAEYEHSFQYFFLTALILLVLEFLISNKRQLWSKDLSLFDS